MGAAGESWTQRGPACFLGDPGSTRGPGQRRGRGASLGRSEETCWLGRCSPADSRTKRTATAHSCPAHPPLEATPALRSVRQPRAVWGLPPRSPDKRPCHVERTDSKRPGPTGGQTCPALLLTGSARRPVQHRGRPRRGLGHTRGHTARSSLRPEGQTHRRRPEQSAPAALTGSLATRGTLTRSPPAPPARSPVRLLRSDSTGPAARCPSATCATSPWTEREPRIGTDVVRESPQCRLWAGKAEKASRGI